MHVKFDAFKLGMKQDPDPDPAGSGVKIGFGSGQDPGQILPDPLRYLYKYLYNIKQNYIDSGIIINKY